LTLLVGQQEGHPARKKDGLWFVGDEDAWSFACLTAPVVTTTSVNCSSNKI